MTVVDEPEIFTRTCSQCRQVMSRIYFSMTSGLSDSWQKTRDPMCNTCLVATPPTWRNGYRQRFLMPSAAPSWRDKAACHPLNAVKRMTPTEQKNPMSTLDAVMFPALPARSAQSWMRFCSGCPVVRECREFGELSGSSGIWGGVYHSGTGETDIG